MHNTLLQILKVLHYFGEFIAIGMRQDMLDETVDSILIKEGSVEITLFHSNCLISQCCFYKKNHDSIHIKNILFSFGVTLSLTEKFGFDLKTRSIRVYF